MVLHIMRDRYAFAFKYWFLTLLQISVWSRAYTASKTHAIPEMDNLIEYLPKNIPSFDGRTSIVHGTHLFQ